MPHHIGKKLRAILYLGALYISLKTGYKLQEILATKPICVKNFE